MRFLRDLLAALAREPDLRENLPAGFVLTETAPGTWRLTLPMDYGTTLEGPTPVRLRRAAWAIHDLAATGYLESTAEKLTLHREGCEPE